MRRTEFKARSHPPPHPPSLPCHSPPPPPTPSPRYKHYKRTMTPQIAAPPKARKDRTALDQKTTICPIPGVTPPPTAPVAIKIKFTSMVLEWRNPAFSGAAPLRCVVGCPASAR